MLWAIGNTERIGLATNFDLADTRVGLTVGILQRPVQMVRPENRFGVEPHPPRSLSVQSKLERARRPR
ncbi:MAG: hypothetical protein R3E12_08480 [Candidatus Eisenbacteria bacterium]